MPSPVRFRTPRRTPLAVGVMTVFALTAPTAWAATTWHVNSCADDAAATIGNLATHTGSLRFTLAHAAAGASNNLDTIQIGLPAACNSTISLTTGALAVTQNFLNINGPNERVTLTAQGSPVHDRVIDHTGTGKLTLTNLDVAYGLLNSTAAARGGCIYSTGSVTLDHSGVYACAAKSSSIATGTAYGGGVFTRKDLRLKYSTLAGNYTTAATSVSEGGGAYVHGYLFSKYSTISDNSTKGLYGRGGGLFVSGNGANIGASTISGNTARKDFGGLVLSGTSDATITNSTVSGNSAVQGVAGGVYSTIPITVRNSTIAFNTAAVGKRSAQYYAPGLAIGPHVGTLAADLQSTLISNNTYASGATVAENDFSTAGTVDFSAGAANLVRVAYGLSLSGIGITGACPLLGPLRHNGGATQTHALLSRSPAIDHGNNSLTPTKLTSDQRGAPFARESGAAADVGAYEVQQNDIVFNTNFETCPPG